MAAPPTDLLNAMRAGGVTRHLFFYMPHVSGDVYAWDGIGEFTIDGNEYVGIGDAATIEGISASADLQTNAVMVTLNGVTFASMQNVNPTVRGNTATITAAWIDENGTVIDSLVVFAGVADYLKSKPSAGALSLSVVIRAKLADWSKAPAAYYSVRDQQRLYPDDTGFNFVRELENGVTSGWSLTEEITSGRFYWTSGLQFIGDVSLRLVGSNSLGRNILSFTSGITIGVYSANSDGTLSSQYVEDTTGATTTIASSNSPVLIGGAACYIDISDDVRTAGGQLITRGGSTTERLRLEGEITAVGTATADLVKSITYQTGGFIAFARNGTAISGADRSNLIYNANTGALAFDISGTPSSYPGPVAYVEDVTGTAVTIDGSGYLQVGGANCTISTTGAVRSPLGNYIVRTGTSDYMRVWT